MYWQIQLNHLPFQTTTLTSTRLGVFIEGNLEEFISTIQYFVNEFFHNLKAGIELMSDFVFIERRPNS